MSAENEINRRIAEALGWEFSGSRLNGAVEAVLGLTSYGDPCWRYVNPAASIEDLRQWVLPEIIKRGLWEDFKVSLAMFGVATDALLIMGKPASIAAAALDVLTVRQEATK